MWNWLKNNKTLAALLVALGYILHVLIEAIVITTLAALTGIKIPTLVPSR